MPHEEWRPGNNISEQDGVTKCNIKKSYKSK